MIVPHRLHFWTMIRYVAPALGILFAYDMLLVFAYYSGWTWLSLPHIPLSLFGTAIGVILGFRNNTAYQRWWEVRTLWGGIVNNSRSLARQTLSMITPVTTAVAERESVAFFQKQIISHQIAYVHALRCHLRDQAPWAELESFLSPEETDALRQQKNVPLAIQQRIGLLLTQCYEQKWIDGVRWRSFDESLTALIAAQGGTERIKNTPLPVQYDYYPKIAVAVYCLVLPLGLVANLGYFAPLGSALVSLIFLTLDRIARTIEINLKQQLGASEIPQPILPVRGVLW